MLQKGLFLSAALAALLFVGIQGAGAAVCSAGDKAEVLWQGQWYPAIVQKVNPDGTQCFIHYVGYGTNWDEWVGQDRIRILSSSGATPAPSAGGYAVGDAVQVLWKGTWYPAHVIASGSNKWKIHYDGYDNSWDEWVGPGRIRKP